MSSQRTIGRKSLGDHEATPEQVRSDDRSAGLRRALRHLSYDAQVALLSPSAGALSPSSRQAHDVATAGMSGPPVALPFQGELGRKLGVDLAGVRAHIGPAAHAACIKLGAEAFAMGSHVAFRDTSPTMQTVAHEIVHVMQQGGAPMVDGAATESRTDRPSCNDPEIEADLIAEAVVRGEDAPRPQVRIAPALALNADMEKGDGSFVSPEVDWRVDLQTSLRALDKNHGPELIESLRASLQGALASYIQDANALFAEVRGWVQEVGAELLETFVDKAPGLAEYTAGWAVDEVASAFWDGVSDLHPYVKVVVETIQFKLGYAEKQAAAAASQAKVDGVSAQLSMLDQLVGAVQQEALAAAIKGSAAWVGSSENAIGQIEALRQELGDKAEVIRQSDANASSQGAWRKLVSATKTTMDGARAMADASAKALREAAGEMRAEGSRRLGMYKKMFEFWQRSITGDWGCGTEGPFRHFGWLGTESRWIELNDPTVSIDKVVLAGSPRGAGSVQHREGNDEDGGWADAMVDRAKGQPAEWSQDANSNNPVRLPTGNGSRFVRLYEYVGFWPDGAFHIMKPLNGGPCHVEAPDGQATMWDINNSSPLLKRFLRSGLVKPIDNPVIEGYLSAKGK